jgi:hypothetical protein
VFNNDSDQSLSILDRIRIEQQGGQVRELATGGTEVRCGSTSGVNDYTRFDASGQKTDEHRGFGSIWP